MKKKVIVVFFLVLFVFVKPIDAKEEVKDPELRSKYVYVYSLNDDRVLYEKESEKKMYPASMTKMMSVLTALDYIDDLDKTCVITEEMLFGLQEANASVAGFHVGDEPTYRDLLYGIMLPFGADASLAVAISLFGSEQEFVNEMNKKAEAMGLESTHFVNTSGLHDDNHYSTVKDMASIVKEGLANQMFKELFVSSSYTSTTGLSMRSVMSKQLEGKNIDASVIVGSKTGFTLEASLCLASYMKIGDEEIVMVTGQTNSDSSYPYHIVDAVKMSEYIKSYYERKTLIKKGDVVGRIALNGGDDIEVKASKKVSLLVPKDADLKIVFDGFEEMETSVFIESYLGDLMILENDEVIYLEECVSKDTIKGKSMSLTSSFGAIIIILFAFMLGMSLTKGRSK